MLLVLGNDFHFQTLDDVLDGFVVDVLADEAGGIVITQVDRKSREVVRFHVHDIATNLSAGHLLDEHGGQLEVIDSLVGVDAALEAERRIGVQAKTTGCLAYPGGMEIGALQEHIGGLLGHTRVKAAKHTTYAHGFLAVANHQVTVGESALHAVEGDKLGALGHGLDHHSVAFHLGQVKAVHGLSHTQQDVVGDVQMLLMGRCPTASSKSLSHLGLSCTFTPRTVKPL